MLRKLHANPMPSILFTVLVDLIGFGILIPVIPLLLADPRSSFFLLPHGYTVKDGFILLGYLTAIFPIMQFIATPILGQLSDKYGRKPVLAFSLFGTCLSYVLFAIGIITRNLPLLFISRAFDGITGGNISVAQAAIADVTTHENRARNFGLLGAVFGIGFVIGPYIGGKLSDPHVVSWFSATTPFWFAAILSFLNVCSILFFFEETIKHRREHLSLHPVQGLTNISRAFSLPSLRNLFATIFLFQGGFTFFTTFFSIFLITRFGFTQGNIGDFFSYVGIWIAFSQAVVTRFVSSRLREHQVLRFSLILTALFIYLTQTTHHPWEVLAITPFFAMTIGLTMANSTALVSRSGDHRIQGEILGISASVQSLAQAIPPILSGYIAASIQPNAPIYVASVVIAVSWLFFVLFYRPQAVLAPATETT